MGHITAAGVSLAAGGQSLRGHPHGTAFVCKRTCFALFWSIVHMDPETWSQGEKKKISKNAALLWTVNPYPLCIDDAITPPLDL